MWMLVWAIGRTDPPHLWTEDRVKDQQALKRMADGDADAVAELYDRHARRVYSLALRILGDARDAEDVVQDVFVQAWRQASQYTTTRGVVAAWLLTLARSRAIDRLRARRARADQGAGDLAEREVADPEPPIDWQFLSAEQARLLRAALDRLPLLQRVAIELAYFEGLTHVEVAARLEEPLGTVKTRIRSGLTKLRETLVGAVRWP
jgi:RNA polymerase sigma-70 factor, ECF subfamily